MLHILDDSHYATGLRRIRLGLHHTHMARIHFHADQGSEVAYVKVYPPGTGGLIGEALGYLACMTLGLHCADNAGLIKLEKNRFDQIDPPPWLDDEPECVWAWCSQKIEGRQLPFHFFMPAAAKQLKRALLKHPDIHKSMAKDETFANGDVNAGSVLRISTDSWAFIDHGECLGNHQWPIHGGPFDPGFHLLSDQLRAHLNAQEVRVAHSQAIEAATQLGHAFPGWRTLIKQLFVELGLDNHKASGKVIPFLKQRTAEGWLAQRLNFLV